MLIIQQLEKQLPNRTLYYMRLTKYLNAALGTSLTPREWQDEREHLGILEFEEMVNMLGFV